MRTRHNNRIAGSILMTLLLFITLAASAYRFADVAVAKPTARIQNVYDDGKDVPKKDNKNNGKNGNGKKPDDTEEPAPKYERIRVDDSESAVFSFKSDKQSHLFFTSFKHPDIVNIFISILTYSKI